MPTQIPAPRLCEVPTIAGPYLLAVKIERRPSLRYLRIVIDNRSTVLLKVPPRVSERKAMEFLRENGDWVMQTIRARPRIPDLWRYFEDQPYISVYGQKMRLRFNMRSGKTSYSIDPLRNRVEMTFDPRLRRESQIVLILRNIAREVLTEQVRILATRVRVKVHGVCIRDQRARWGSCNETGGLSLNWRLILLTPELQDHVILHELAHLTHFDHSPAFYRLLKRYDPLSEKHGKQLNDWSTRLMGLGREPGEDSAR